MTNRSDSTQNSGEPIEKEFGDFCCRGDITGHCDCGHRLRQELADSNSITPKVDQLIDQLITELVQEIASAQSTIEAQAREIGELKAKYEPDCYCVCHSSISSCPSCEHCKGINAVSDFHLRKEIGELREGLKKAFDSSLCTCASKECNGGCAESILHALLSSTGKPADSIPPMADAPPATKESLRQFILDEAPELLDREEKEA